MRFLCIGDVVGHAGCAFLRKTLPAFRKVKGIDFVIVNGENSAEGNGITPASAEDLFTSGADVITSGNHVFRRREIYPLLDDDPRLLRPANYPASAPGKGVTVVDTLRARVRVVNLMGTVFLDSLDNPFLTADRLLSDAEPMITIVDFHAEATSEKRALGFYLDGRVSAVFGTHTHVQTADEQILPKGTGYLTDAGMTGPCESVLGVEPSLIVNRFLTKMPCRFANASGECSMNGVILDINNKTFHTDFIDRIQIK